MLDYVQDVRQIAGQGDSLDDEFAESDEDPDENTPTPAWPTWSYHFHPTLCF
jgi:hypothetical protein